MSKYYDIKDDIKAYPDAWAYIIWSKRGPGKTYSTLRYMIENDIRFVFMKRTIDDVNLMCKRLEGADPGENDLSPFSPLNRDFNWDIYPFIINSKGLAAFYHAELGDDGELRPKGKLLGWCIACASVSRFKGFSMDAADYLIFDEFIPKNYERVAKGEGDSVLDLYMTIKRDRDKRGREPLKLVLLANATDISNPMFKVLELTDTVAQMDILDTEYTYLESGIMLHFIQGDFDTEEVPEVKTGIEKHMEGTQWGDMAFSGHFSYNDFSCIGRTSLKGYRPVCSISYKRDNYYIYVKDNQYYMTHSKHNSDKIYNLNRENDQKLFYIDYDLDLREACINDCMIFETYTMYDLIVNYKKFFRL